MRLLTRGWTDRLSTWQFALYCAGTSILVFGIAAVIVLALEHHPWPGPLGIRSLLIFGAVYIPVSVMLQTFRRARKHARNGQPA